MKVLLLNSSEEIMRVIHWFRAVKLLTAGKARRPYGHEDDYDIRTTSGVFKLPTALVLVKYVRVPYKSVPVNKNNVLKRDNYTCQYCGCRLTGSNGTIDHVYPQCFGGKHKWNNVVAACGPCNGLKDNLTLEQAEIQHGMKLLSTPFTPSWDLMSFVGIDTKTRKMWSRWVAV